MKKVMLMAVIGFTVSCANAQKLKEADVPAAVKEGFKKQYPNAKVEGWEKEGANYEAEFDLNKTETSVVFDASGKLLETETEIAESALPKAVLDQISKTMPGKKVKEAAKIVDASGKVKYEAEIEKKDYLFEENGTPIAK